MHPVKLCCPSFLTCISANILSRMWLHTFKKGQLPRCPADIALQLNMTFQQKSGSHRVVFTITVMCAGSRLQKLCKLVS